MKEKFEGSDRIKVVRLLTLKREFELLKMKESEGVKDYVAKLVEIVNQIRLYGKSISNQKVVEKVMISLPDKFQFKILAREELCDLMTLTVAELISKL